MINTAVLLVLLLGASVSDIRYQRVSDKYWVSILLLSFLEIMVQCENHIGEYAAGFLIIGAPLCALAICVPGSFGGADIKMMSVCGALLGARVIVLAFICGICLAGGRCMADKIARRTCIHIPLIPFFSLGIAAAIVFEQELTQYFTFVYLL